MPTDIKLDRVTHDLDISTQRLEYFETQANVVAQRMKIALLMRRGEWFPDISVGVPYLEFTSIKNNKGYIDDFMSDYIRRVEGVNRLNSYESVLDSATRVLKITASAICDDGTIANLELEV